MRKRSHTGSAGSGILTLAILLLSIFALSPARVTQWVQWFRGPLQTVLAPGETVFSKLSTTLRPSARSPEEAIAEREIRGQLAELQLQLNRSNALVNEYRQQLDELRQPLDELRTTRRVIATRVGRSLGSGTLEVRAGTGDGINLESVAVARGTQQLVGIVTGVGVATSTIHLLTDPDLKPDSIEGRVFPAGTTVSDQSTLPSCMLRPLGNGRLIDPSVPVEAGDEAYIQVGSIVRLNDLRWPSSAQMLTIGRIVDVRPGPNPQFREVVVEPLVQELGRLPSVILYTPGPGAPEPPGPPGSSEGAP